MTKWWAVKYSNQIRPNHRCGQEDQHTACDAGYADLHPWRSQPSPRPVGQEDEANLPDDVDEDENHAELRQLGGGVAFHHVQEVGHEGEVEENDLRIQHIAEERVPGRFTVENRDDPAARLEV